MKIKSVLITVSLAFFILCVSSSAFAGPVTFMTQPGTAFNFTATYSDGSAPFIFFLFPTDGVVKFVIPNQENVSGLSMRKTNPNGRESRAEIHLSALPSLEPFEVPNFSALDPTIILTYDIDLNAFLAAGNPFTVGQTFSIVNGMSSLTDAIIFRDQLGNLFSGSATVEPFDRFDAVPEPTTMLLLGTGLAGVAIKTCKRLKVGRVGKGRNSCRSV